MAKLWELETIAKSAQSPDGRWQLLQDWLKDNPSWNKQINKWLELTSSEAYLLLKLHVANQTGLPSALIDQMINIETAQRVRDTIETLQTCYRNRQAQTRKEITE
jgi:uncharacterized Zn finger protein